MKDDVEIAAYVAREEGRAEGREEGRMEGREEGRMEGRAEGREEERRKFFAERAALWAENRRLMALLAQKA